MLKEYRRIKDALSNNLKCYYFIFRVHDVYEYDRKVNQVRMTRNCPKFSLVCHSDNYQLNHYFDTPFFPRIKLSSIVSKEAATREVKKINLPQLPVKKLRENIQVDFLTGISNQPIIFSRIISALGELDLKNLSDTSPLIKLNMKAHRCFRIVQYKSKYY